MAERKFGTKEFSLIFAAANLILFLMYFIPYYALEANGITEAYEYIRLYIEEIIQKVLPPATAAVLAVRCSASDVKKLLTSSLLLTLPNLAYTLPFYYLLGIEYGGDTPEALLMSFIASLGYLIIFFAHIFILFFIIKRSVIFFTAKEQEKKIQEMSQRSKAPDIRQRMLKEASLALPDKLNEGKPFDLSYPASLAFFFASLFDFSIYFVLEIYDSISYLTAYSGSYTPGEIAYMIFRFVFLLLMLFVTLGASQFVKKKTAPPDITKNNI